jgi:AP-1 complex subunit beta-1
MSSIASVYHKPPSSFVQRKNVAAVVVGSGDENKEDDDSVGSVSGSGSEDDYQSESEDDEDEKPAATQAPAAAIDLLGMDLLSMDSPAPSASTPQLPQLLAADAGHGLQVNGQLARVNGTTVLQIQIVNVSSTAPAQTLALQCNKNTLALGPVSAAFQLDTPAAPGGGSGSASVPLIAVPKLAKTDAPAPFVEVALKDMATGNVLYFRVPLPLEAALVEDGRMEQGSFVQQWKSIPTSNEVFTTVQLGSVNGVQGATSRLQTKNILFVAKRTQGTDEMAYYSMKTITGVDVMLELTFRAGVSACRVCIRTNGMALAPFAQKAVQQALTA